MNGTRERIKVLMGYKGESPVVSLYLKLGPQDRAGSNYRITFKNLLRNQMESLEKRGFTKKELEKAKKLITRVKDFIESPENLEGCGGLALFAGDNLFEVFKLPYGYMDRMVVDTGPLVRGLIAMTEEIGTVYAVVLDSKLARFFRIEAAEIEEVGTMKAGEAETLSGERPGMARSRGNAFSAHSFDTKQRVLRDEIQRFYKAVADRLFERFKRERFDWLVVAGSGREDLLNHLHPFVSERLLGLASWDSKSLNPNRIRETIAELMEIKKQQWEDEILTEFVAKRESGLATCGPERTLEALHNGQIRTLIVKRGYTVPGFRNPDGTLSLEGEDGAIPVPDLIDEIMEECLAQGAEVFIAQKEELTREVENIGAILRFRL
ncbi:MAG: host attachment protein [candidate division WOR-3 bacterium]